jgi:bifunctional non-homologous end joining protein LigD
MPTGVEPELPALAAVPPPGEDWVHEIKFDGYRILASVEPGKVILHTRRGNDWTDRIPFLAEALRAVPVHAALLDGEVVSLDDRGISDFQRLQDALGGAPAGGAGLVYFVFDLLYLNGVDLRGVILVRRKALLAELLARVPSPFASTIRLSDHVIGRGPAFLAQATRMGLEGIVSKQGNAPYRSGRSHSWLKIKCTERQEFVVVGFTDPKGTRNLLGALLLATYTGGKLVYRGRVGTGFSENSLRDLYRRLGPLRDRQPSLIQAPTGQEARGVHWVKPELVAEVSFLRLTQDGLVRHSSFLGLREDKAASEVVLETSTGSKARGMPKRRK